MSIINYFKNILLGATNNEIKAAELSARIDVLMAKHGSASTLAPSEHKLSIQERVDLLAASNSSASVSMASATAENTRYRRILEPDEQLYLKGQSRFKSNLTSGADSESKFSTYPHGYRDSFAIYDPLYIFNGDGVLTNHALNIPGYGTNTEDGFDSMWPTDPLVDHTNL